MEPAFFDEDGERRTAAQQAEGLPMFELAVEPPSVPVASSERGAEAVRKSGAAQTQAERILEALWAAGCVPGSGKYLSRDDIMERLGLREGSVNARLGPSTGLAIRATDYRPGNRACVLSVEDACVSRAGSKVLGYILSSEGASICSGRNA